MMRYIHFAYGSFLLGLAGISAYVLCSADALEDAALMLVH
jgi:hypothetical protein